MLKITSVEDLKKYLKTRRKMAEGQKADTERCEVSMGLKTHCKAWHNETGQLFAFDEAIKAVEALLTNDHEEEC